MEDRSRWEEEFIHFCDRLAEDDGFVAKLKRKSAAKKDWRALDPITKRDVIAMTQTIVAFEQIVTDTRHIVDYNYRTLARLPKRSRIRRLKYLDEAETALLRSTAQQQEAVRSADRVLRELGQAPASRPSILPQLLTWWKQQAASFLAKEKQELVTLQRDLHGLKRRTPGRKRIRYATREDMEKISRDRVDRPPSIIKLPPEQSSSPATRWHSRDLGTSLGAINKGLHVLIRTDDNGLIVYRTVRKTVLLENHWDLCGDLPREHVTQAALSGLSNARFVLRVEQCPEPRGRNVYHLYLEFAPHGDLFTLANNHRHANRWIPEEFLWLLFQSLIESALLMKCGSLEDNVQSPPDWQEMVHRDLKPENIVLGLPVKRHFQMYPRPKLADFGGAIFTSKDDPVNPDFYATFSTPGLAAPEQYWYVDPVTEKPVDRFPVLSPCNVWGIGAVMYGMMTLQLMNRSTQPPYAVTARDDHPRAGLSRNPAQDFDAMEVDGQSDVGYETAEDDRPKSSQILHSEAFRYTLHPSVKNRYDGELCDMVDRCMNFDPDSRPRIEDLKMWLDGQFKGRARLRDLNSGRKIVGRAPEPALCQLEKDDYRLRMQWQSLRIVN